MQSTVRASLHVNYQYTHLLPSSSPNLELQARRLALYAANDLAGSVLGDDLVVVQHFEFLCGITTHEVHECLGSTWVLVEPIRDVEDDALDHDPEVLLGVVLGNCIDS
jgi:hypothetical protein